MDEERIELKNDSEATDVVREAIRKARDSGRWMVAVYRVEDGRININRTTFNFPTGDYLTAVALLAANLSEEQRRAAEAGRTLPDAPLPTAPGFGDGNNEPLNTVRLGEDYRPTVKDCRGRTAADYGVRPEPDVWVDSGWKKSPVQQEEKPATEDVDDPPHPRGRPPVQGEGEELQE